MNKEEFGRWASQLDARFGDRLEWLKKDKSPEQLTALSLAWLETLEDVSFIGAMDAIRSMHRGDLEFPTSVDFIPKVVRRHALAFDNRKPLVEEAPPEEYVPRNRRPITGVMAIMGDSGSGKTTLLLLLTGDAGAQAVGSVGAGACTHEGNGYHTYAPAQAETNGDLLAFTFTGTGAIPATIQIFTTFPQTVDHASNIAAIKTVTDALPNAGALTSLATAANLATLTGYVDTEVAAIKAKTDNLPSDPADASDVASLIAAVSAKVDTVDDFLDTEIAAIKAKTDQLTFTVANQVDTNIQSVNDITVNGIGTAENPWGP